MIKKYYFYQDKYPRTGIVFLTEERAEQIRRQRPIVLTVKKL